MRPFKIFTLLMCVSALSACVEDGVYQTDYYRSTTTYVPAYPRHHHRYYNYPTPDYGYQAGPSIDSNNYNNPAYHGGRSYQRRYQTGFQPSQPSGYSAGTGVQPQPVPPPVNNEGFSAGSGSTSATPVPPVMRRAINPAARPLVPTTPTGGYTASPGN
jgi:hypothetical protein